MSVCVLKACECDGVDGGFYAIFHYLKTVNFLIIIIIFLLLFFESTRVVLFEICESYMRQPPVVLRYKDIADFYLQFSAILSPPPPLEKRKGGGSNARNSYEMPSEK